MVSLPDPRGARAGDEVGADFSAVVVAESGVVGQDACRYRRPCWNWTCRAPRCLMFRPAATGRELNVVYRRSDGHIGWIDPSSARRGALADRGPDPCYAVPRADGGPRKGRRWHGSCRVAARRPAGVTLRPTYAGSEHVSLLPGLRRSFAATTARQIRWTQDEMPFRRSDHRRRDPPGAAREHQEVGPARDVRAGRRRLRPGRPRDLRRGDPTGAPRLDRGRERHRHPPWQARPAATSIVGVFARLERPIEFESLDGAPVDLAFLLVAPEASGADHLKALARIARDAARPPPHRQAPRHARRSRPLRRADAAAGLQRGLRGGVASSPRPHGRAPKPDRP